MLISRPSPFPKLVQRSRRPISTAAITFGVPGRKDDSIGTVIMSVLGLLRKKERFAGNAMVGRRMEVKVLFEGVVKINEIIKFPSA